VVRARKAELALDKRQRRLAKGRKAGPPTLLVVGGGAAGHTAIETLRRESV
jgi:UDP-N-acetylglucosamine:LPS N-acetylglucosamine transferase